MRRIVFCEIKGMMPQEFYAHIVKAINSLTFLSVILEVLIGNLVLKTWMPDRKIRA